MDLRSSSHRGASGERIAAADIYDSVMHDAARQVRPAT